MNDNEIQTAELRMDILGGEASCCATCGNPASVCSGCELLDTPEEMALLTGDRAALRELRRVR